MLREAGWPQAAAGAIVAGGSRAFCAVGHPHVGHGPGTQHVRGCTNSSALTRTREAGPALATSWRQVEISHVLYAPRSLRLTGHMQATPVPIGLLRESASTSVVGLASAQKHMLFVRAADMVCVAGVYVCICVHTLAFQMLSHAEIMVPKGRPGGTAQAAGSLARDREAPVTPTINIRTLILAVCRHASLPHFASRTRIFRCAAATCLHESRYSIRLRATGTCACMRDEAKARWDSGVFVAFPVR